MLSRRLAAFAGLVVLALVTGLGGLPARAQTQPNQPEPSASHLALGREVVALVGATASVDEIIPALLQDIRQQNVTRPELLKDLDEVLKGLTPELELQRQQAVNIAARVYARYFTEAELRDIVAFYKTPVGVKWSKMQPDIVEDAVRGLGDWSQQLAEYMMTRTRVEMTKRGHTMQ